MTNEEKRAAIAFGKKLQKECKHEITEQYGNNPKFDDDGCCRCSICGEDLGWWCPSPESPNHTCEYYGIHSWSPGWSTGRKYRNEDDCIYCHQPEERK